MVRSLKIQRGILEEGQKPEEAISESNVPYRVPASDSSRQRKIRCESITPTV